MVQSITKKGLILLAIAIMSHIMTLTSTPVIRDMTIKTVTAGIGEMETPATEEMLAMVEGQSEKFGKYSLYQVCIFKFIATEGIVLNMYSCAAGYQTFGIGCVADTPEERELVKSGLTYQKVRAHLEKEFIKIMERVEKDAPAMYNKQQKAALAMLFMSIGYERFWKKNQKYWNKYCQGYGIPEDRWLKQCRYKATSGKNAGQYVESKNLKRSKQFECALFHNRVDKVVALTTRFHRDAIIIQKRLSIWKAPSNSGPMLLASASLE